MSREHYLMEVFVRTPIDRTARVVTSQARTSTRDAGLSREDLSFILSRLLRKHRLLKHILGIRTKSQLSNARWLYNRGERLGRFRRDPRAFLEFMRLGEQIQIVHDELALLRRVRQLVALAEGGQVRAKSAPKVVQLAADLRRSMGLELL